MADLYCIASGLVIAQAGIFTAKVSPISPQGPMTIRPHGAKDLAVAYDGAKGVWSASLAPGEYVLWLQVPDPKMLKDTVTLLPPKGSLFVYLGPKSNNTSYAWAADRATISRGDPKDPWPPPQAPEVALGAASKAWFEVELKTIADALPKGAVIKHHPPRRQ